MRAVFWRMGRLAEADFSDDRPMTYEEKRELRLACCSVFPQPACLCVRAAQCW